MVSERFFVSTRSAVGPGRGNFKSAPVRGSIGSLRVIRCAGHLRARDTTTTRALRHSRPTVQDVPRDTLPRTIWGDGMFARHVPFSRR